MRQALLLDLDDTLYDERTYVLSGLRAVAHHLASIRPNLHADACFEMMVKQLERGRDRIFDRTLLDLGHEPDPATIEDLVGVYRHHEPRIEFYKDVARSLDQLSLSFDLAIVTDGLGLMQRRKVAALGLPDRIKTIVYCWELNAPKPRPEPYLAALQSLGHQPENCIVVGDNPAHDIAAAHAIGVRSVRVRTGRFAAQPNEPGKLPTREISRFSELHAALALL